MDEKGYGSLVRHNMKKKTHSPRRVCCSPPSVRSVTLACANTLHREKVVLSFGFVVLRTCGCTYLGPRTAMTGHHFKDYECSLSWGPIWEGEKSGCSGWNRHKSSSQCACGAGISPTMYPRSTLHASSPLACRGLEPTDEMP